MHPPAHLRRLDLRLGQRLGGPTLLVDPPPHTPRRRRPPPPPAALGSGAGVAPSQRRLVAAQHRRRQWRRQRRRQQSGAGLFRSAAAVAAAVDVVALAVVAIVAVVAPLDALDRLDGADVAHRPAGRLDGPPQSAAGRSVAGSRPRRGRRPGRRRDARQRRGEKNDPPNGVDVSAAFEHGDADAARQKDEPGASQTAEERLGADSQHLVADQSLDDVLDGVGDVADDVDAAQERRRDAAGQEDATDSLVADTNRQ